MALLICAIGSAYAGFTKSVYLDETYDATQPLADGTVYIVTNDVTFTGAYDGYSGLAVAPGAEVVIFVHTNCYLRSDGNPGTAGGPGGGAGILCPSNSTLVITGQGTVGTEGGNALDGQDLQSPDLDYCYMNEETQMARAYKGGTGSVGGSGGGAGIGGAGGSGGLGGVAHEETPRKMVHETYNANGLWGVKGGDGGDAGTVWLLGTAELMVIPGEGGKGGGGNLYGKIAVGKQVENSIFSYDYCAGGAVPGGAGAAGMGGVDGIGGGGGGSGGNGGYYCWYLPASAPYPDDYPDGGCGYGGKSENGTGDGKSATESNYKPAWCSANVRGGYGGAGGAGGKSGTGGCLYQFEATTLTGLVANDAIYETNIAPASVRYKLTFNSVGTTNVYLGGPVESAPVPKSLTKNFVGWYTQKGGFGRRWFDENGQPFDVSCYDVVGDTTLYPVWIGNGTKLEDYRLSATQIEIGTTGILIPVSAETAAYTEAALEFAKVRASETLPFPENAPVVEVQVETLQDGRKVLVIKRNSNANSMFYRIDVEDVSTD